MKSHVSMEQKQCIVCGKTYDTGAILLDKRLKASMERNTLTGTGLCPEHKALYEKGFIALVEIDPSKSTVSGDVVKNLSDAYRTGMVVHLKRDVWVKVFDSPAPNLPMVFIEPGVIEKLQAKQEK